MALKVFKHTFINLGGLIGVAPIVSSEYVDYKKLRRMSLEKVNERLHTALKGNIGDIGAVTKIKIFIGPYIIQYFGYF